MIARSTTGFPALRKLLRDEFPPFLRAIDPFLRNLNPLLTGLDLYKREITAAMANVTAATNAVTPDAKGQINYLRALGPFQPESLATFNGRLSSNRNSAYSQPLASTRTWPRACPTSIPRQCSSGLSAVARPEHARKTRPSRPASENERPGQKPNSSPQNSSNALKKYALGGRLIDLRALARVHPAGPLRADLRQRRADQLPARL